jgi:ubiquinone/menaquinone biosynthesis C-methylase UbiE
MHEHTWDGDHAQKFAKSAQRLIKFRYVPFAKEIKRLVDKNLANRSFTIMDIGCGPGFLLFQLKMLMPNARFLGVDASPDMIELARVKAREQGYNDFEFKVGPAENIPLPDGNVDVIICLNSFHDFQDSQKTVNEVFRVLKEGGFFILKDKNGSYPKWKMKIHFYYLRHVLGKEHSKRYYRSSGLWFNPHTVIEWMERAGFQVTYLKKKVDYVIMAEKSKMN